MPSARALRAGRAVIELGLLTKGVESGLRMVQGQLRDMGASLARIGTFGAGGGGFAGLRNLFIGSAAAAAAAWPVKFAADIEVAAEQLAVFTGSTESARAMLLDLQRFSAVAMVPFEELSKQASLMLRFGVSTGEATEHVKALAVLAAGSEDEFDKLSLAFAQVASAGRLQGEEMRQFKNTAFNPLREIAERTGESMDDVRKRMEAAGVSFSEVASALQAAVGPGGRFDGMLQRISGTLIGQVRKALAQIKLAVLPIGEEVLPTLSRLARVLNGAIPALAAFIKQHSSAARTILGVAAAIAGVAIVFTTLGLGVTVVSIAAGGLASLFGILSTSLGAIISPVGLLVGGLGALTVWFMKSTEAGQQMAGNLANWFKSLAGVVRTTMDGIANALVAGNIQAAARVLWAGLRLTWLEGTNSLRQMWINWKDVAIRTIVEFIFAVESHFATMVSRVKMLWEGMVSTSRSVGEQIGHWLTRSSDPQLAAEQDRQSNLALSRIEQEGQARMAAILREREATHAAIESARQQAQAFEDNRVNEELGQAQENLKRARQELKDAADAARSATSAEGESFFGKKKFGDLVAEGVAVAADIAAAKPVSLFDTRLAAQSFGANPVQRQQLDELRKIRDNTGRRGGLPVV